MGQKKIFGISIKCWTILSLVAAGLLLLIFVISPFVIALLVPLFNPEHSDDYAELVTTLDGTALVVGLFGTVASICSILMTLSDKRRYEQEKNQTNQLFSNIEDLQKDSKQVQNYVRQTFELNRRLGVELYKKKIIETDPSLGLGISTGGNSGYWSPPSSAQEKPE